MAEQNPKRDTKRGGSGSGGASGCHELPGDPVAPQRMRRLLDSRWPVSFNFRMRFNQSQPFSNPSSAGGM